jgi:hypothetical protein
LLQEGGPLLSRSSLSAYYSIEARGDNVNCHEFDLVRSVCEQKTMPFSVLTHFECRIKEVYVYIPSYESYLKKIGLLDN